MTNDPLLIPPYGGRLVDLMVEDEERAELIARANQLSSVRLSPRSVCDLELLATGGFSPLDRFMGRCDYLRVIGEMRLADGAIFPIPVTLPVSETDGLQIGREVALRSPKNELLAVMLVEEIYEWDRMQEAAEVYRTTDSRHPLVAEMASWGRFYISGPLRVLSLPKHYDFPELRHTPQQVRALLVRLGRANVVAFQTRNPMHRAHEELTRRAAQAVDGTLLIHPSVGLTNPGDVDHYTRVRSYKALVERYYDPRRTLLSLLPLAMRMAGPRSALWHAIIRRNYGANYLIVGRDHASPGRNAKGEPFYGPYEAQQLCSRFSEDIGVRILCYADLVYLPAEDRYEERHRVPRSAKSLALSGTEAREKYLACGRPLPAWFTRPEVMRELARAYPPKHQRGFCIWLTGLPSAGKSTIADVIAVKLVEHGRRVTLLDGDVVRTHLSKGLDFSREGRDTNVLRIGFVASEVVRHNGAVICAAISPYQATRDRVRLMIGEEGFIVVFVNTPLEVCERRDVKGIYARARASQIKGVTGIDAPYEPPADPDLVLDTCQDSPEECAQKVIELLRERGFLRNDSGVRDGGHDVHDKDRRASPLRLASSSLVRPFTLFWTAVIDLLGPVRELIGSLFDKI